jgi:hypothetical protein
MTAMKASGLERVLERNLAGPLDRREAVHSSSDFEPAGIRHGSTICAESDGPALWSRLRRRSRLAASNRQVDLRLASRPDALHAMGAEGMGADCESRGRLCGVGASLSIYAGIWLGWET